MKSATLQYGAAASLSAASVTLKGWDDALAKECLHTAVKLWEEEQTNPTPAPSRPGGGGPPGMGQTMEWRAALELLIATNGGETYMKRLLEIYPTIPRASASAVGRLSAPYLTWTTRSKNNWKKR